MLRSKPFIGSLILLLSLAFSILSLASVTQVYSGSSMTKCTPPLCSANLNPLAPVYYSNHNEAGKITALAGPTSVTVTLTQPITTQQNEWWAYQYNLFWSNSSSPAGKYPFMSQTTIDDNSGECKIGTGYGTHTEQIQQPIDCSEITQPDDSWQIVTTWNSQNLLSGLSVYVDGVQKYSIHMATICKGFPSCSVSSAYGAYFQSVFVGRCSSCGGHQSVTFTSLAGTMSYSGVSPMVHYPACTSEFSNAIYYAWIGSGYTFSQSFTYAPTMTNAC